jgi:hypothetical protein
LEYLIEFIFQARWALSSDTNLQAVGTSTKTHYYDDYEEYLKLLKMGLYWKKKSVVNIIREWDSRIFPNTDSSLVVVKAKASEDNGVKKVMASLDADSDENNSDEG